MPRRLLTDLSHQSRGFPRATLLTRINVAALVESRDRARIPWPHLYELPQSVAAIIVERDWSHDGDSGEKALFLGRLKAPEAAALSDLATRLLAFKNAPIGSITEFRRALAVARLRLPLRLLLL